MLLKTGLGTINWLVCGFESGKHFSPLYPRYVGKQVLRRNLVIALFVKQMEINKADAVERFCDDLQVPECPEAM